MPSFLRRLLRSKLVISLLLLILILSLIFYQRFKPLSTQTKSVLTDFNQLPKVVQNNNGQDSDLVNVVFVGRDSQITRSFNYALWNEADPINAVSSIKVIFYGIFDQYYYSAPMSDLYLFGKRQDTSFQKPSSSVRRRDHIRIWDSGLILGDGREIWVAAATYDDNITFDRTNFLIPSHSVSSDIDKERDLVIYDLQNYREVEKVLNYQLRAPFKDEVYGPNKFSSDGFIKIMLFK